MKKEEKKTEKKVVVSKEKWDKLVAENDKLVDGNDKLIAENKELFDSNNFFASQNLTLERSLRNQQKTSIDLSKELLRLKSLIENNNKRWFSRKIKF